MAITKLDEILKLIVGWEKKLNSFYSAMQKCLKSERSRKAVEVLKQQQERTLGVLQKIDIRTYKKAEFIKNPPDYRSEELFSLIEITENSSPSEIFDKVLSYEEKLEKYYAHVRDILAYKKDRELLEMLVQFKMGQIKRIKSYMDSFDLVV